MVVLSGVFVAARVTQRVLKRSFGVDDYIIIMSLVSNRRHLSWQKCARLPPVCRSPLRYCQLRKLKRSSTVTEPIIMISPKTVQLLRESGTTRRTA